ncbi:MFS transporter, partial [Mycobacteriaceae bacterium Msp059]|nr:MFS transporter [Mycobacteriaceae bacterium Msp059]
MPNFRGRFSFALLAYAFLAIMLGTTLPTPMYALYADRMLFALLVFGRWSDAVGRRPILLASVVAALASAGVFLVADSVPVLLIGRVLSGISAGLFTGSGTAAVIEAAPPAWRSRAAAVASQRIGLLAMNLEPLLLPFIVHIVLAVLAGVAVLIVPETSSRAGGIRLQRLSVPIEVRRVFIIAALAAFAGFTVTGLYTAVAPSFLSNVIGITNHAVAGAMAFSIFAASALAQIFATRIPPQRAVAVGCAILVFGMIILAVALYFSSLPGLIAAAVVSGAGQGISFSRGLAAVAEQTPAERRAEVSSTYFVVAYVALSIPVVGVGFAAQDWGLCTAGITFA